MGAEEHSGARRLCLIRQFAQRNAGDRIQTAERFVEHQEPGRSQERLGKDNLLPISFGQGLDTLIGARLKIEALEELPSSGVYRARTKSLDPAHVAADTPRP